MISRVRKAFFLAVFVFAMVASAGAAGPSAEAKQRAALYKAEVKEVLLKRRWEIKRDEVGKLVAVHAAGPDLTGKVTVRDFVANNPMGLDAAHLTIVFQAKTPNDTTTSARSVLYSKPDRPGGPAYGPIPFTDKDTQNEIWSIMAQAEKQLAAKHPEYAAR